MIPESWRREYLQMSQDFEEGWLGVHEEATAITRSSIYWFDGIWQKCRSSRTFKSMIPRPDYFKSQPAGKVFFADGDIVMLFLPIQDLLRAQKLFWIPNSHLLNFDFLYTWVFEKVSNIWDVGCEGNGEVLVLVLGSVGDHGGWLGAVIGTTGSDSQWTESPLICNII